ncbi:D-2-hydroxyacid dehydrogenase [Thaumasiovibrio subtropicus]|uniref:D-2-hydroxyacid dehydrogenase n=1 Tax=Thaumasiovibrio subtropicus TaxID=1891207 RepID=UPI000B355DC0|nr:D-2-hydroxyacid dehydrogenase [Thaumasiovibrio subtropicus]
MNKLLILSRQKEKYLQLLSDAQLPHLSITDDHQQANIVLADPPLVAGQLDNLPRLQWLQSTFAGIDALTTTTLRQDYTLTNVRGIFGPLIAEYVMGYLIQHYRDFTRYADQQRDNVWQPHHYSSLQGKRILILGTGSIGGHLARVAKVMGMKVLGLNRSGIVRSRDFDKIFNFEQLHEVLPQSDVIVSTLPATSDTHNLLNQTNLLDCKGALLFSVGRGDVLSESGLLDALEAGTVRHAWLDVFKQEPLPTDHPLWQHPAVTLTPHIAAESFPDQVFNIFSHNYLQWHAREPLDCVVDFDKGY